MMALRHSSGNGMDSFCSKSYSTNIDRQRHHIVKLVITFFCHLIRLNLCINQLQRYTKFWKVIRIYNIFRIFAIRLENRSFKNGGG